MVRSHPLLRIKQHGKNLIHGCKMGLVYYLVEVEEIEGTGIVVNGSEVSESVGGC